MSTEPSLKQAKHTLEIIAQHDLDADDMRLLHDGFLSDFLEGVHCSRMKCLPTRDELRMLFGLLPLNPTLVVDYNASIREMVDAGAYDLVVDQDHSGNAKMYESIRAGQGIRKVKIRLERINESVCLAENAAERKFSKDYRLASYEEIFAFGIAYPRVQRRCEYGIFGAAYGGNSPHSFQPNLHGSSKGRVLCLRAGGIYSNPRTHFLFVER